MSRSTTEFTFAPDPVATIDAPAGAMPQIPDAVEARVWILSEGEGLTQKQIADRTKLSQGTVSRSLARATVKIAGILATGLVTREAIERQLRKSVGIAPRT